MDEEINSLEKFIFSENKETYIQKLISDTEPHYYFSLLHSLDKYGVNLPEDQEKLLQRYKKFKTKQSKGIRLRYLFMKYDAENDPEEKKKIVKKLNSKLFKYIFKHNAPKHLQDHQQDNDNYHDDDKSDNSENENQINQIQQYNSENFEEDFQVQLQSQDSLQLQQQDSQYSQQSQDNAQQQIQIQQQDAFFQFQQQPQQSQYFPQQQQQQQIPQQMQQPQQSQYFPQQQQQQQIPQQMQMQQQQNMNFNNFFPQQVDIIQQVQEPIQQQQQKNEKPKSILDQSGISFEKFLDSIYTAKKNEIHKITLDALSYIDIQKISTTTDLEKLTYLLQNIDICQLTNQELGILIASYTNLQKKQNKSYVFDQKSIFQKITLDQLLFIKKTFPDFTKLQEFQGEIFSKQFYETEDPQADKYSDEEKLKQKLERLKAMYNWCKDLPTKFQSMSDQILYELLITGELCNTYDFDYFILYMKQPKNVSTHFNKRQQTQFNNLQKQYQYDSYWHNVHNFKTAQWIEQQELTEKYLKKYYQVNNSKTIAPFDEFFQENYLQKILIQARLDLGERDIPNVSQYFDPREISKLYNEKLLQICKFNKKYFYQDEPVKIFIEIQNIQVLQVKIFEFQAENYFLKTYAELDNHIDLDGLTANEEKTFDFSSDQNHPCKKIIKEITLDSISAKKQGLYVIEFFGQGIASRIVIRKGQLNLIQRTSIAGDVLKIINQKGEIQVPGEDHRVGIWTESKFYSADAQGEILLPYKREGDVSQQVILVSGSFASITNLLRREELYSFTCNYIYNNESFLMGQKCKIIVQPTLRLYNEIVPLKTLQDGEVIITTINEDKVPNTTKFDKIKFSDDFDYEAVFQIPAKLLSIKIQVKAKIKSSSSRHSKDGFQALDVQQPIMFQTLQGSTAINDLFLQKNENSEFILNLLGKNGEPRKNIEVIINFHHVLAQSPIIKTLLTSHEGQINLGLLDNIYGINCQVVAIPVLDINEIYKSFLINHLNDGQLKNLPSSIKLCKGETLKIPFINNFPINKHNFLFVKTFASAGYETSERKPFRVIENCLDKLKVEGDYLTAENLPEGQYFLRVKAIQKDFTINIYNNSQRWVDGYSIIGKYQFFDQNKRQLKQQEPFTIKSITQNDDLIKIQLNLNQQFSENLRVHVQAFQFFNENVFQPGKVNNNLFPQESKQIQLLNQPNVYMSNRQLGDEFAYVLNRKEQTRFTGNSLEKPPILLKRNFIQDTQYGEVEIKGGDAYISNQQNEKEVYERDRSYCNDFQNVDDCDDMFGETEQVSYNYKPQKQKGYDKANTRSSLKPSSTDVQVIFTSFQTRISSFSVQGQISKSQNFLKNPTQIFSNLKPNTNGEIELKLDQTKGFSGLQIVFSTPYHTSTQFFPIKSECNLEMKDITQKQNLARDKFYSIFRYSTIVNKNDTYKIADITSTEFSLIDTVEKIFDLQVELSKFNKQYGAQDGDSYQEKWGFLKGWYKLTEVEKLKKFNEMVSHELNIFIYFKDKLFFENVVAYHLSNKIEKTLIDYFLLGNYDQAINYYNCVERLQELNIFEINLLGHMLLVKGKQEDAASYIQLSENILKLKKQDKEHWKKIYDIVLNQVDKSEAAQLRVVQQQVNLRMNQAPISNTRNLNMQQQIQQPMYMQQQVHHPFSNVSNYAQVQFPVGGGGGLRGYNNNNNRDNYSASLSQSNSIEDLNDDDSYSEDEQTEECVEREERKRVPSSAKGKQRINKKPKASKKEAAYDFDPFDGKYQQQKNLLQGEQNNLGKTKEYCERHYLEQVIGHNTGLGTSTYVVPNLFWNDLAKHLLAKGVFQNFLSKEIIYCYNTHTEMIFALSVMDIPFEQPKHVYQQDQLQQNITAASDLLIFTKQIKECPSKLREDILITQRFFDNQDRYYYDEENPQIYYEKDATEFIVNKIYGCQIILTNCTVSQQQLQVLYEIPEGSIPLQQIEYTKSQMRPIEAYSTTRIEFFFYFPKEGTYLIYPANAAKDGEVCTVSKQKQFEVNTEKTITKLERLDQILEKGSKDDILKFIETKNILNDKIFKFEDIMHLLKDKDFFLKLFKILQKKKIFNETVFSYSIYHTDHESLQVFLNYENNRQKIQKYINFIESKLIKLPGQFEVEGGLDMHILEYYPIINSRVHLLKLDSANILNVQLKKQYHQLLGYIAEKKELQEIDKLIFVYYLLIQERIQDALKIFKTIQKNKLSGQQLQHDYIAAYLDFYDGYPNFKIAREIIENYLDYPVISWRNLFYEMANQLAEYDGENLLEDDLLDDQQKKNQKDNKNAEKEQLLTVKIVGKNIEIEHKNLGDETVTLTYYIIDLEVFFSKKPFVSQLQEDFGYLQPAFKETIKLPESGDSLKTTTHLVPQDLQKVNVYVQANVQQKKSGGIYFSTKLKVMIFENHGQIKITDEQDKALSKVYIKIFAKMNDSSIKFHKDGYTDLRGKFDYLQLNSEQLTGIQRFSFFIMSDDLGSIIKEASIPSQKGQSKDTVELRSKNWIGKYQVKVSDRPYQSYQKSKK